MNIMRVWFISAFATIACAVTVDESRNSIPQEDQWPNGEHYYQIDGDVDVLGPSLECVKDNSVVFIKPGVYWYGRESLDLRRLTATNCTISGSHYAGGGCVFAFGNKNWLECQ